MALNFLCSIVIDIAIGTEFDIVFYAANVVAVSIAVDMTVDGVVVVVV